MKKILKKSKPNFFIVGARKTGTTSLYHYLKKHPEIFMSPAKEPHYFSKNINYHIHLYSNEDDYLSLFKNVKNEKVIGEASTSYLDDENIPSLISSFQANSKIIIILRDPVELIYSMHFEFAFRGRVLEDFQEELQLQQQGNSNVDYLKLIKNLPNVINKYIQFFGEDHVYIMNYDDFKRDNQTEFTNVLKFLAVNEDFKPEFKKYNTSSKPKNLLVSKLLNSKIIHEIGKIVHHYIPGGNKLDPFVWNMEPFERPEMPILVKEMLEKELKKTKEEFSILLNKNI